METLAPDWSDVGDQYYLLFLHNLGQHQAWGILFMMLKREENFTEYYKSSLSLRNQREFAVYNRNTVLKHET